MEEIVMYLRPVGKARICAHMFNTHEGRIENDFLIEKGKNTNKFLNPFSQYGLAQFLSHMISIIITSHNYFYFRGNSWT